MLLRMPKDDKCSFSTNKLLFVTEICCTVRKKSSEDYPIVSVHSKMLCYEDGEIKLMNPFL